MGECARKRFASAFTRQARDYLETRSHVAATRNCVHVAQYFARAHPRVWRTHRKMASRLAKTIRGSAKIETTEDWKAVVNFQRSVIPSEARDLSQAGEITPAILCNPTLSERSFVVCATQDDTRRKTCRFSRSAPCHSSFQRVWNRRTCHDRNVASSARTLDSRMEE